MVVKGTSFMNLETKRMITLCVSLQVLIMKQNYFNKDELKKKLLSLYHYKYPSQVLLLEQWYDTGPQDQNIMVCIMVVV